MVLICSVCGRKAKKQSSDVMGDEELNVYLFKHNLRKASENLQMLSERKEWITYEGLIIL